MSREIDRQIAELMGYELSPDMDMYKEGKSYYFLPEFSTDWNAMRLLVEWLHGKYIKVRLYVQPVLTVCEIIIWKENDWLPIVESHEHSAPLALCKAVLSLPPEVLK